MLNLNYKSKKADINIDVVLCFLNELLVSFIFRDEAGGVL
jgi:hypothetical protein